MLLHLGQNVVGSSVEDSANLEHSIAGDLIRNRHPGRSAVAEPRTALASNFIQLIECVNDRAFVYRDHIGSLVERGLDQAQSGLAVRDVGRKRFDEYRDPGRWERSNEFKWVCNQAFRSQVSQLVARLFVSYRSFKRSAIV